MAMLASPAWAGDVPAISVPQLTAAGSSAATKAPAVRKLYPLRPRDAKEFARLKAAADAKYSRWLAAHGSTTVNPFAPLFSIIGLNKPGFSSTDEGNGNTPPDTTGAAGPNYYLEFVNSALSVYNRSTLASPPVDSILEDTFTGSSRTCDGQIKWDQQAGRWLYWSLDCGQTTPGTQGWSIGFSKTSNPLPLAGDNTTSAWCKYHVATGHNVDDYGKLGQDNGWIIVGVNRFQDNNNNPSVPIVYTLSKPAVGVATCPAPTSLQLFSIAPTAANAFTPEPANIFGSSTNGYVVAEHTFSTVRMYRLTGLPPAAPVLHDDGDITVPTFATPPNLPQPGSTDKVDTSDTRLTQANAALDPALGAGVFGIWTQHTVAGPGGAGSVVRWYELKDLKSTPVQTGTVAAPGTGSFAFNGAISPTIQGNAAAIDYNTATPSTLIQVRARIHAIGAAAGTTSDETVLANSGGIVNDFSCPSQTGSSRPCRWGDYAGASFDPLSGDAVWGTAELTGVPDTSLFTAQWETQNFKLLLPDENPTAAFTASASPPPAHTEAFNGTTSKDPDGSIVSWTWNFGDGHTGAGATIKHTYATAGTETVTLTVKDSDGKTASVVHNIVVS